MFSRWFQVLLCALLLHYTLTDDNFTESCTSDSPCTELLINDTPSTPPRVGFDGKVSDVPLDQRPKITEALEDIPPHLLEFLKKCHEIEPGSDTLWHVSEARFILKTRLSVSDEDLQTATLYHSIYGPLTRFTGKTMQISARDPIRAVIGTRAEATAYAHCVMNRESFDRAVIAYLNKHPEPYVVQVRDGAPRPLLLSAEELRDVMTVHFADWIQQLVPYDFWGYRREAYSNLANALGSQFLKAYEEMIGIQPEKYKTSVIPEMHRGQSVPETQDGPELVENWAQTMKVELSRFVWPENTEELSQIIRNSSKVRVAGSRHSCAPLIESEGIIISTSKLNNILEIDVENFRVRFQAGVTCSQLVNALAPHGLAVGTLGTIDWQTVVGAAMTGTHGGALSIPSLHTYLESYKLILADGSTINVSRDENNGLFHALSPSLGLFGVVSEAVMRVVPLTYLEAKMTVIPWEDLPQMYKHLSETNKYLRVVVYPTLQKATIWSANPVQPTSNATNYDTFVNFRSPREELLLRKWLELYETELPEAHPYSDEVLKLVLDSQLKRLSNYQAQYNHVLCLERNHGIPHADLELAFDYGDAEEVLKHAIEYFKDRRVPYYNFEIRSTARDENLISCCHGRDTLWIDFQAKAHVCEDYFQEIEDTFSHFSFRKHWAKGVGGIIGEHPKIPEFKNLIRNYDPVGKFQNKHVASFVNEEIRHGEEIVI